MNVTLDHILWAVPDLEKGIAEFERRSGVRAAIGGRHPGVGTHNALLSLEAGRYFEIIAPDPSQDELTGLGALLVGLKRPTLLTWAGRTDDIEALASSAHEAGMTGEPIAMSRRRPDGGELSWKILQLSGHDGGELVPFFIGWDAGVVHPSETTPRGCRLADFWLEHPDPPSIKRWLDAVGFGRSAVTVRRGEAPVLKAEIETPAGRLLL